MFKDELYLNLSKHVYSEEYTIVDNYVQLILPDCTNENGYYKRENFASAAYKNGNKIIISFRGTDDDIDKYVSDLDILLGNVPRVSYLYAEEFYLKIKSLYPDAEIEFTGHSLGGAIAQLMGAKFGHKTVTFNAPG